MRTMLICLPLLVVIWTAIHSHLLLRKLLHREHDAHYEAWEGEGKPRPPFSRLPSESFFEGGYLAYLFYEIKWLFRIPNWVNGDQEAIDLLRKWRALTAVFYLGIIALVTEMTFRVQF